ncbi:MAG: PIN domain-containing protein [Candidatus Brennerbacteria bacterium]|nr:PIN domain-containing protein [Candidatus Brennerbacteria bacterium]
MPNNVFIDSNVFIAELNKDDALHSRAKTLLRYIEKQELSAVTSNFVINEVITVLSQRASKKAAIAFADFIYSNDVAVDIIAINKHIEIKAVEYLKSLKSKNVSFCDCATLAVLDLFAIGNLATFDKDFKPKNGNFKIIQ